jgi:8-oxo-dGTP pyrophosphatase MutT (NUDIX family)
MTGAAILPATIINGSLYFLFGKENKFEQSAPGFSDFGGGMKKGEKVYDAAIREACEELTGFLGNETEVKQLMAKHGTYKVEIKKYSSFIFPLKYDPKLETYYNNNQKFLQRKLPDKVFKTTCIFEKEHIRWIKADDLKKQRYKFRNFYRFMIDLIYNEQKQIKSFVKKGLKQTTNKKTKKRKKGVKNKSFKKQSFF